MQPCREQGRCLAERPLDWAAIGSWAANHDRTARHRRYSLSQADSEGFLVLVASEDTATLQDGRWVPEKIISKRHGMRKRKQDGRIKNEVDSV